MPVPPPVPETGRTDNDDCAPKFLNLPPNLITKFGSVSLDSHSDLNSEFVLSAPLTHSICRFPRPRERRNPMYVFASFNSAVEANRVNSPFQDCGHKSPLRLGPVEDLSGAFVESLHTDSAAKYSARVSVLQDRQFAYCCLDPACRMTKFPLNV